MEEVKKNPSMSLEDEGYELQKAVKIEKNFTYFNQKQKDEHERKLEKQKKDTEALLLKIINEIYETGYMEDEKLYVNVKMKDFETILISDNFVKLICDELVKQGWPRMCFLYTNSGADVRGRYGILFVFACTCHEIISEGRTHIDGVPIDSVD